MEKGENSSRITKEQIERLVQIMEANPEVAKGVCINPASFWHDVNLELNSLGPSKDKFSWMKTWTDKKSNVKKKFKQIKDEQTKTGGGTPILISLNDIEERILNVTNIKVNADGVKNSICIGVPNNYQEDKTLQTNNDNPCVSEPAEEIHQLHIEPLSATPNHITRTKPQKQKPQHETTNTVTNPPVLYQKTLIDQNEAIANSLADIASTLKIFVTETVSFQKEVLEILKKK